jgi:hypothetical protein
MQHTSKEEKRTLYLAANSDAGIPDGNFWSNLKMFLFTKPGINFPAEMYSERMVPALDCETTDMESKCSAGGSRALLKRLVSSAPYLEDPKSTTSWGNGEKLMLHGAALDKLPCMDSLGGDGIC